MIRKLGDPFVLSGLCVLIVVALCAALRENAGGACLIPLSLLAAALPAVALFASNWWIYALKMSAAGFVALVATLIALDVSGAVDKMGPGGMAYLLPMLIFLGASGVSGLARLGVQTARQLRGAREGRAFFSSGLKRGLAIAAALFAALTIFNAVSVWLAYREDAGAATQGQAPPPS